MHPNPHIKLLYGGIIRTFSNFFNDINHLQPTLNYPMSLIDDHISDPLIFIDPSIITHDDITVTNRVDFINFVFLAKLVKP